MQHARFLCVDDEPAVRQLLREILTMNGHIVHSVGTVSDALAAIAEHSFDVLVADLNIGQPGDGFTVVSAMRRTHPDCVSFILTGYPAIDAALQAIRSQVDGYFIKPADTRTMLGVIEARLNEPRPHQPVTSKRISDLLRDRMFEIVQRSLQAMKEQPELAALPLSDEERISLLPAVLHNLADMVDSPNPDAVRERMRRAALELGRTRAQQGYTIPLLLENMHQVQNAVSAVMNENLLLLDLSHLLLDIRLITEATTLHMKELVKAYQESLCRAA